MTSPSLGGLDWLEQNIGAPDLRPLIFATMDTQAGECRFNAMQRDEFDPAIIAQFRT